MRDKVLVINPGSTSTKIAVFDSSGQQLWSENIPHGLEELSCFDTISDQIPMRETLVRKCIEANGTSLHELRAIASRGGPFARVESGAYLINEAMLEKIRTAPIDQHASNLGAGIAYSIARDEEIPAYIYDAVTVDEMIPVARITGLKEMERHGQGHNLNMRAAALEVCRRDHLNYYESNILVAHLGGGITLSLHQNGRIVDMISDDEGPFAPERAGGLPVFQVIELCYSGKYTKKEMFKHIQRSGGLIAHFGTPDSRVIEKMIADGDENAGLVYEAMALNVAKNLAKLSVVAKGAVDRIVLTGGIAYSDCFTGMIRDYVSFLAPVAVIPGENEMQALYGGVMRVLRGEENAHIYKNEEH